jgi:hypothetical protein
VRCHWTRCGSVWLRPLSRTPPQGRRTGGATCGGGRSSCWWFDCVAVPRHHRRSSELSQRPTCGATHHRSVAVEERLEDCHPWTENQPTVSRDATKHRPVRLRTLGVATAPQRPAHVAASAGRGRSQPSSVTCTPPVGGSGPRQRGQRRHAESTAAKRSGTNSAPHRRQRTYRLMDCPFFHRDYQPPETPDHPTSHANARSGVGGRPRRLPPRLLASGRTRSTPVSPSVCPSRSASLPARRPPRQRATAPPSPATPQDRRAASGARPGVPAPARPGPLRAPRVDAGTGSCLRPHRRPPPPPATRAGAQRHSQERLLQRLVLMGRVSLSVPREDMKI